MPLLVARASALVHLSDDEGTPVTPLEGFAVGAAVVASRLPAFEEALGELGEFVDNAEIVRSPDRLAEALSRAIESGANDAERSARMQHARAFTWERNARETVEVWRKVIARPR